MSDDEQIIREDAVRHTVRIILAYIQNHQISPTELPKIISETGQTAIGLMSNGGAWRPRAGPAVPISSSVQEDYLICLEDGERRGVLSLYLRHKYGMSPDEYRQRWGLPINYPMVAPGVTKRQAEGRAQRKAAAAKTPSATRKKNLKKRKSRQKKKK